MSDLHAARCSGSGGSTATACSRGSSGGPGGAESSCRGGAAASSNMDRGLPATLQLPKERAHEAPRSASNSCGVADVEHTSSTATPHLNTRCGLLAATAAAGRPMPASYAVVLEAAAGRGGLGPKRRRTHAVRHSGSSQAVRLCCLGQSSGSCGGGVEPAAARRAGRGAGRRAGAWTCCWRRHCC